MADETNCETCPYENYGPCPGCVKHPPKPQAPFIPYNGLVYRHKRTGVEYRVLFESFDVETQRRHIVYVSIANGQIFNRDRDIFAQNFEYVCDTQAQIEPKK